MPIDRQLHNIRHELGVVFDNLDFYESDDALVIRIKKSRRAGLKAAMKTHS